MYSLDENDRIGFSEEFVATNDQKAVTKVRDIKPNARQCEVWEGRRLVAEISMQEEALNSAL